MRRAWSRRLITIPIVYLLFVLFTLALPIIVIAGAVVDLVRWLASRTPAMTLRGSAFAWAYLLGEAWAIPTLAVIGLLPHERAIEVTYRLQMVWLNWNLNTVRFVFSLRFSTEGDAEIPPAPILVLSRHASIIDTLLPGRYITQPFGIKLRYVLKKELLVDPALDIAGNRLPNVFVERGGDTERELGAIRRLVETMPDTEGVLIYPEGTRYSEAKRIKFADRVAQRGGTVGAIASEYRKVLPPRPAGTLALVAERPMDVVVLAHRGFEGFAEIRDMWSGGLVRSHVQLRFHRIPRAEVPSGEAERTEWLFRLWAEIDDWISA